MPRRLLARAVWRGSTRGPQNRGHDLHLPGHAFLNDAEAGPRVLGPLMRATHIGPDPEAAADAWRRIEAFFRAQLG
jgi:dienelactone hydrolase